MLMSVSWVRTRPQLEREKVSVQRPPYGSSHSQLHWGGGQEGRRHGQAGDKGGQAAAAWGSGQAGR